MEEYPISLDLILVGLFFRMKGILGQTMHISGLDKKKKRPVPDLPEGETSFFRIFLHKLRKKGIIQTFIAFLGGGVAILEFTHHILINHYHFPKQTLDIFVVSLSAALIAVAVWRWFRVGEIKKKRIKIELFIVPPIIALALAMNLSLILQMEKGNEHDKETKGPSVEWTNSVAVLPLSDLSDSQDQALFCEGMTEDLITKLTTIEGLKVISRTSIMRYKDTKMDIRTVGKELNVNTILEGSIQKEGNRLRITVQLINVENGFHLWADQYDRELASIFAIQDEISRAVVNALRFELGVDQEYMLAKRHTEDHKAHELYLKGRASWGKRTEEGLKQALDFFQQAINRDPGFAKAYVGMADAYNMLGSYDVLPAHQVYPKAKEMALKAIELDDSLAEAYTSLAWVKYRYEWDWFGAETDFNWAIGLNPRYSTAHQWYGAFLRSMGRFDEAKVELERARELDPFSMSILTSIGILYYYAREYDSAVEQCRHVIEKSSQFHWAHNVLAASYLQKYMFKEAIQEFRKAIDLSGGNTRYKADLAHAYAVSGFRQEAQAILDELQSLTQVRHVPKFEIALIFAVLGDRETAFKRLDEAYQERSTLLISLNIDPRLDVLRSDVRFSGLLEKIGLYDTSIIASASSRLETSSPNLGQRIEPVSH